MKCFILINSSLNSSFKKKVAFDIASAADKSPAFVICADSGADLAYPLIVPDLIIGDLDSISDNVRSGYEGLGVEF
ncbi:MAG TPA: thiamine diphosphokinase, partial [Candidatus Wallbacteria bacterium]|nr:thiamine diphosphokinase [Candidatus Wallbacteria bacterium]